MKPPTSMRARSRRRNARAAAVSAGLVIFAAVCSALLVSGFSSLGTTQKAKSKAKVVKVAKAKAPKTTTAPPATAAPANTVVTTSTTTSTTTTTVPTVATLPPPPPPTVPPPPPTVPPPLPTASATVSDTPSFCTVTVRLSTGAQQIYPLSSYVANPGDLYTFTAAITAYRVDVKVAVVSQKTKTVCTVSLSNVARL